MLRTASGRSAQRTLQEFTNENNKYNGKVDGDTIKGKTETTRGDGQSRERDWEAKRAKDDDKDKKDGDKKEDST